MLLLKIFKSFHLLIGFILFDFYCELKITVLLEVMVMQQSCVMETMDDFNFFS